VLVSMVLQLTTPWVLEYMGLLLYRAVLRGDVAQAVTRGARADGLCVCI